MNFQAPSPVLSTPAPLPTSTTVSGSGTKARQTAEAFESFFLSQVLAHMSSGLEVEGPFGGGGTEKTFRSMLHDEYAKAVASRGGVGIADLIQEEILRLQEVSS